MGELRDEEENAVASECNLKSMSSADAIKHGKILQARQEADGSQPSSSQTCWDWEALNINKSGPFNPELGPVINIKNDRNAAWTELYAAYCIRYDKFWDVQLIADDGRLRIHRVFLEGLTPLLKEQDWHEGKQESITLAGVQLKHLKTFVELIHGRTPVIRQGEEGPIKEIIKLLQIKDFRFDLEPYDRTTSSLTEPVCSSPAAGKLVLPTEYRKVPPGTWIVRKPTQRIRRYVDPNARNNKQVPPPLPPPPRSAGGNNKVGRGSYGMPANFIKLPPGAHIRFGKTPRIQRPALPIMTNDEDVEEQAGQEDSGSSNEQQQVPNGNGQVPQIAAGNQEVTAEGTASTEDQSVSVENGATANLQSQSTSEPADDGRSAVTGRYPKRYRPSEGANGEQCGFCMTSFPDMNALELHLFNKCGFGLRGEYNLKEKSCKRCNQFYRQWTSRELLSHVKDCEGNGKSRKKHVPSSPQKASISSSSGDAGGARASSVSSSPTTAVASQQQVEKESSSTTSCGADNPRPPPDDLSISVAQNSPSKNPGGNPVTKDAAMTNVDVGSNQMETISTAAAVSSGPSPGASGSIPPTAPGGPSDNNNSGLTTAERLRLALREKLGPSLRIYQAKFSSVEQKKKKTTSSSSSSPSEVAREDEGNKGEEEVVTVPPNKVAVEIHRNKPSDPTRKSGDQSETTREIEVIELDDDDDESFTTGNEEISASTGGISSSAVIPSTEQNMMEAAAPPPPVQNMAKNEAETCSFATAEGGMDQSATSLDQSSSSSPQTTNISQPLDVLVFGQQPEPMGPVPSVSSKRRRQQNNDSLTTPGGTPPSKTPKRRKPKPSPLSTVAYLHNLQNIRPRPPPNNHQFNPPPQLVPISTVSIIPTMMVTHHHSSSTIHHVSQQPPVSSSSSHNFILPHGPAGSYHGNTNQLRSGPSPQMPTAPYQSGNFPIMERFLTSFNQIATPRAPAWGPDHHGMNPSQMTTTPTAAMTPTQLTLAGGATTHPLSEANQPLSVRAATGSGTASAAVPSSSSSPPAPVSLLDANNPSSSLSGIEAQASYFRQRYYAERFKCHRCNIFFGTQDSLNDHFAWGLCDY